MKYTTLFSILLLLFVSKGYNQTLNEDTGNVNSADAVIHSLYDVISGSAGEQRDWDGFRSLFSADARMYIAVPDKDSGTILKSITPEEYIQRNETRLSDIGFNEKELYRITNTYGAGTQIFSTYESHYANNNGEEEITQGINSIQLFFDGSRYFIVSIFWDANSKNGQVPQRYLPKEKNTEYQITL